MQGSVKWLGKGAYFEGITAEGLKFELAGPPQLNGGVNTFKSEVTWSFKL